MLKAIYAEVVQEDDIILCRGVGGGDDGILGLIGTADVSELSFGATDAAVAAVRRVCHGHSAKAVHLNLKWPKRIELVGFVEEVCEMLVCVVVECVYSIVENFTI